MVQWELPPQDWIKLNTDGASKQNGEIASCGGVMRDSSGRRITEFAANVGAINSIEAELWGLFYSLSLAWSGGYRRVMVATDS